MQLPPLAGYHPGSRLGGFNYTMKTENGKLYVEPLPDGRYRFRLRYLDPRTGKAHRVNTIKASNSRQAYNQALRELQDRVISSYVERPTLDQARKMYLADKARILKPQTILRNDNEITAVNRVLGEDVYLDKLTAMEIRQALDACSKSNTTYNERLARYKAFLSWCYENDLLPVNLGTKLKPLPDQKRERIQDKYLEPEELQLLLDQMKLPLWYYLTYFMVLSGLRIGEAMALELEDVGEKYISVNKTFSLVTFEVGSTKTDNSCRDVFIQPELRDLIDEYLIFRSGHLAGKKSKLFFPAKSGERFSYEAYNKYLKENTEKAIGRKISTHALRHTSASLFLAAGVPLEAISRRLGHADSRITKEIYLHMTEKLKSADEAAIAGAKIL